MMRFGTYKYGRLLYLDNDIYMGRFLSEYGEYSDGEIELFRMLLRPGDIVIEVGANIGCHTIPMGQMVQPGGAVFAVEPQNKLYYMLCGNVALNDLEHNVNCLNMAIGSTQGSIAVPIADYSLPNNFGGCSLKQTWKDSRPVALQTLDAITSNFDRLRLLKADVEGMEVEVLAGARQLITRLRPFLYVEDDRPESTAELRALMRSLGYRLYLHQPFYVNRPREELPEDIRFMVSTNIFGVPTELDCKVELEEL